MKLNEEVGDLHQMNPTSFFSCGGVHEVYSARRLDGFKSSNIWC